MTGATDTPSLGDNAAPESPLPGVREIFRRPLPHQAGRPLTRFFIKSFLSLFRSRYLALEGFEHIGVDCDPFILAANHSQRPEAVLVPAAVFFHRKGKPVHFMADWNLKLIPGIALVYSCGQIITVDRKPAKPAFLNVFRPMLTDKVSAPKRAQERLEAGPHGHPIPRSSLRPPHPRQRSDVASYRTSDEPAFPAGRLRSGSAEKVASRDHEGNQSTVGKENGMLSFRNVS